MSDENINMNIEPVQEVQPLNVNVNVTLLLNIKAILEIATSRGGFKANELTSVGKIYDEVSNLLK